MLAIVAVMVAPVMITAAMPAGVTVSAEDQQAYAVDDQSENRNKDRPVESDGHGRHEPCDAFPGHDQSEESKHHRAGKAGQRAHLAGAEIELSILRVAAGVV